MALRLFIFFSGAFSLILNRRHILVLLLSLEYIILGLFFALVQQIFLFTIETLIFFFVLVVCEASLGLRILIIAVYFYGEGNLSSYSVLRC